MTFCLPTWRVVPGHLGILDRAALAEPQIDQLQRMIKLTIFMQFLMSIKASESPEIACV